MGGGSGGVIIRDTVKAGLSDPTVHGQLPPKMQLAVDAIFAKESSAWSPAECKAVSHAADWALCNLQ